MSSEKPFSPKWLASTSFRDLGLRELRTISDFGSSFFFFYLSLFFCSSSFLLPPFLLFGFAESSRTNQETSLEK